MGKTRKFLGMAATALALAGAATPAAAHEYKAHGGVFSGGNVGSHTFKFGGTLTAVCKQAGFSGSLSTPSPNVLGIPKYSECSLGGLAATVTLAHCGYELHEPKTGLLEFEAKMSIINSGGFCNFEFSLTGGCRVEIEPVENLGIVEEKNIPPEAIKLVYKLKELHYFATKCIGTGNGHDGTYEGTENVEGLFVI
jgi:hypothetical protein